MTITTVLQNILHFGIIFLRKNTIIYLIKNACLRIFKEQKKISTMSIIQVFYEWKMG